MVRFEYLVMLLVGVIGAMLVMWPLANAIEGSMKRSAVMIVAATTAER